MSFDGRLLSGMSVLAAVVEAGSFSRAGDVLGLSASGVSRSISRLEERLGVRLLDRTTRTLHLTSDGANLYERAAPHLEGIEAVSYTHLDVYKRQAPRPGTARARSGRPNGT